MAYSIARWVARGGSHNNYYMFAGRAARAARTPASTTARAALRSDLAALADPASSSVL